MHSKFTEDLWLHRKYQNKGNMLPFFMEAFTFYYNGTSTPFGLIFCTYSCISALRTSHILQDFAAVKSTVTVHQPLKLCPILKFLHLMQAEIISSYFCFKWLVKLPMKTSPLLILPAVQQETNWFFGSTDNCFPMTYLIKGSAWADQAGQ